MNTIFKPGLLIAFLCLGLSELPQMASKNKPQLFLPENEHIHKISSMINMPDTFISNLLQKYPQFFSSVFDNAKNLKVQIIYSQVDRLNMKKSGFTDYTFNVNSDNYFYPASTVKLPVAILALQKLNELKIAGLNKYTTMITGNAGFGQTEVNKDSSAADGRATIAHYIKKILLVSDNDAFNRLYEFLGQEYINKTLHKMGYADVQIIHRLDISMTEEQNRQTNPINFLDKKRKLIYAKPAQNSVLPYANRNTKLGIGYIKGDKLINEPFNFSQKNRLSLQDLHMIVRSIIYPESVDDKSRFNLTKDDYNFLRKYMSMKPEESVSPVYKAPEYWDNYVKFLFYGSEKDKAKPGLRIFNKVGDAYGFLTDAVYFADFKNNIEFFLSATIYSNSDGVFNDDKYDYDSIGFPFLKNLGKAIYEYELTRVRKKEPNLSNFRFNYIE
ncbi:MAG: serine hydrolase [Chitinophagaceae bacterium]